MKKLTKKYGQPVCVALYALFAALAARKKPIPLCVLLALHGAEYLLAARPLAKERGIPLPSALAHCLAFGFTWWRPIKYNY